MDSGFCWVELVTTDREKAAWFYGRLLGWTQKPLWLRSHGGLPVDYSLLGQGERVAGGLYQMLAGHRAQGLESHWLPYAFVADVDETVERARELGARVLAPPLDVQDLGRLSILLDPQGAVVGAWQSRRLDHAFQTRHQPGFPCWFEHDTGDPRKSAVFYTSLFGWNARSADFGTGEYVLLEHDGRAFAGITTRPRAAQKPAARWLTFFQVTDCDASCAKLGQLHGTLRSPPVDVPGAGRHAIACDPQGADFGLTTALRG